MSVYNKKPVGILLFEQWHNREDVGSSRLRGHWYIKNWEEAEQFRNGAQYEVIIFQKVYWKEYAKEFKGVKILDVCDPDWLDTVSVKEMIDNCDAITVSSEGLQKAMQEFTDKPVVFIPDRQDLSFHTKKKDHKGQGKAKKVIWFGYSQNAKLLDPTLRSLKKMGLQLTVLSECRPPYSSVAAYEKLILKGNETPEQIEEMQKKVDEENNNFIRNVKYQWENPQWSFDDVILEHDIVLLPPDIRPRGKYKSTNKTLTAWTLGMPVARNKADLERFLNEDERVSEGELRYNEVREKFDVKQSVQELKDLIAQIKNGKTV